MIKRNIRPKLFQLGDMSAETIDAEDWKKRELKRVNRLTGMEETAMRRGWSLSDIFKSIFRPSSPRNFLKSPRFSRGVPKRSLGVSERSVSTVQSDSSQRRRLADRVEDLEGRHTFNFEVLRNPLDEALDPTEEDDGTIEGLEDRDRESVMKAMCLYDSDEDYEDCEDDEDDEDDEDEEAEENLSDGDYFYGAIFRPETSDGQNPFIVEEGEDEEPLFAENPFADPLEALEDQERGLHEHPTELSIPTRPETKKTWLMRSMVNTSRSRRRMPTGPGRFVNPPGSQLLVLIACGVETSGAHPTRGEIELWRHSHLGQHVSFSSPLRHCWTYKSSQ